MIKTLFEKYEIILNQQKQTVQQQIGEQQSYHQSVGDSFINIEASSNNHGNEVFVSFERTDISTN